MTHYRNCIIKPDPFLELYFEWYHEDREGWHGIGDSIEECMKQIDDCYEDFNN
jgi:hypothetical protein